MANVSATTTGFFPTAKEGFITTTSGTVSSGAATVGLNSVAGYSNGEYVTMVIEPSTASAKQVFTGQIDTAGVQVTGVTWTEGTNQTHTAGVTVVDYETATAWALQRKGLLVTHNEDGTQKTNSITTASILDSNVTTAKIADSNVTTAKVADDAITDAKLVFGKVRARQGGSASDWSAVGTTTHDVSASNTMTQVGTIFNNANPKAITFPVAFANPPFVVAIVSSVNSTSCFAIPIAVTAAGFSCQVYDNTGATNSNQNVNWIAIGI